MEILPNTKSSIVRKLGTCLSGTTKSVTASERIVLMVNGIIFNTPNNIVKILFVVLEFIS